MRQVFIFTLLLIFLSNIAVAQSHKREASNIQFGIKAGTTYSKITDLDRVLVSESYYTNYDFSTKSAWGATTGIYLNYKLEETISAFYSEIAYNRLNSVLDYSDVNAFKYTINMRYDYITWEFCYKAYVLPWMPLSIGPRLGFNLTPNGLFYKSNGSATYGPDIRIQQDMRDVLKGKSNVAIGVGLGIELYSGLSLDLRYYYGVNDVNETLVNNYNFVEVGNASRSFEIKLGYALPYNMSFH